MASPGVNLFDIDNERKSWRKSPAESPLRPCERKSWRKSPVESLLRHGDGDYSASSPESDCGRSRRKVYS